MEDGLHDHKTIAYLLLNWINYSALGAVIRLVIVVDIYIGLFTHSITRNIEPSIDNVSVSEFERDALKSIGNATVAYANDSSMLYTENSTAPRPADVRDVRTESSTASTPNDNSEPDDTIQPKATQLTTTAANSSPTGPTDSSQPPLDSSSPAGTDNSPTHGPLKSPPNGPVNSQTPGPENSSTRGPENSPTLGQANSSPTEPVNSSPPGSENGSSLGPENSSSPGPENSLQPALPTVPGSGNRPTLGPENSSPPGLENSPPLGPDNSSSDVPGNSSSLGPDNSSTLSPSSSSPGPGNSSSPIPENSSTPGPENSPPLGPDNSSLDVPDNGSSLGPDNRSMLRPANNASPGPDNISTRAPDNSSSFGPDNSSILSPSSSSPGPGNSSSPIPENSSTPGPENSPPLGPDNSSSRGPEDRSTPEPDNSSPTALANSSPLGPDKSASPGPENGYPIGPENSSPSGSENSSSAGPEHSSTLGPEHSSPPGPGNSLSPGPENSSPTGPADGSSSESTHAPRSEPANDRATETRETVTYQGIGEQDAIITLNHQIADDRFVLTTPTPDESTVNTESTINNYDRTESANSQGRTDNWLLTSAIETRVKESVATTSDIRTHRTESVAHREQYMTDMYSSQRDNDWTASVQSTQKDATETSKSIHRWTTDAIQTNNAETTEPWTGSMYTDRIETSNNAAERESSTVKTGDARSPIENTSTDEWRSAGSDEWKTTETVVERVFGHTTEGHLSGTTQRDGEETDSTTGTVSTETLWNAGNTNNAVVDDDGTARTGRTDEETTSSTETFTPDAEYRASTTQWDNNVVESSTSAYRADDVTQFKQRMLSAAVDDSDTATSPADVPTRTGVHVANTTPIGSEFEDMRTPTYYPENIVEVIPRDEATHVVRYVTSKVDVDDREPGRIDDGNDSETESAVVTPTDRKWSTSGMLSVKRTTRTETTETDTEVTKHATRVTAKQSETWTTSQNYDVAKDGATQTVTGGNFYTTHQKTPPQNMNDYTAGTTDVTVISDELGSEFTTNTMDARESELVTKDTQGKSAVTIQENEIAHTSIKMDNPVTGTTSIAEIETLGTTKYITTTQTDKNQKILTEGSSGETETIVNDYKDSDRTTESLITSANTDQHTVSAASFGSTHVSDIFVDTENVKEGMAEPTTPLLIVATSGVPTTEQTLDDIDKYELTTNAQDDKNTTMNTNEREQHNTTESLHRLAHTSEPTPRYKTASSSRTNDDILVDTTQPSGTQSNESNTVQTGDTTTRDTVQPYVKTSESTYSKTHLLDSTETQTLADRTTVEEQKTTESLVGDVTGGSIHSGITEAMGDVTERPRERLSVQIDASDVQQMNGTENDTTRIDMQTTEGLEEVSQTRQYATTRSATATQNEGSINEPNMDASEHASTLETPVYHLTTQTTLQTTDDVTSNTKTVKSYLDEQFTKDESMRESRPTIDVFGEYLQANTEPTVIGNESNTTAEYNDGMTTTWENVNGRTTEVPEMEETLRVTEQALQADTSESEYTVTATRLATSSNTENGVLSTKRHSTEVMTNNDVTKPDSIVTVSEGEFVKSTQTTKRYETGATTYTNEMVSKRTISTSESVSRYESTTETASDGSNEHRTSRELESTSILSNAEGSSTRMPPTTELAMSTTPAHIIDRLEDSRSTLTSETGLFKMSTEDTQQSDELPTVRSYIVTEEPPSSSIAMTTAHDTERNDLTTSALKPDDNNPQEGKIVRYNSVGLN